jgi:hypothetical protein
MKNLLIALNLVALLFITMWKAFELNDQIVALSAVIANMLILLFANLEQKKIMRRATKLSLWGIVAALGIWFIDVVGCGTSYCNDTGVQIADTLLFISIIVGFVVLPQALLIEKIFLRDSR